MVALLAVMAVLASAASAEAVYYGTPPTGVISTQISRVNTPGCSYGSDPSVSNTSATFPPILLSECTQPIAPGAVDLRGLWKDPNEPDSQGERIEQCGLRIIIIGGGVIHDTYIAGTEARAGTLANGVIDVSYYDCSPINVSGRFNATEQSYTFYDTNGAEVVSRQLISANVMQWIHPLAGTVNYTRVLPPPPPPRRRRPPPRKGGR